MYIASSLSYSKSLQNPIDRTWMMMIILPEVPVDTHTLPVLLFTKDRYSPPGVLSALAFGAPASQGGGSLQALARKASKAMQAICVCRCGQPWCCLRHHSLQKGIERLEDATATVYVPACICAFFSILESEKYVSLFHSPPCKTKIPNIPPKPFTSPTQTSHRSSSSPPPPHPAAAAALPPSVKLSYYSNTPSPSPLAPHPHSHASQYSVLVPPWPICAPGQRVVSASTAQFRH